MSKAPRRATRATRGAVKAVKKTATKRAKKRPAAGKRSRRGANVKRTATARRSARAKVKAQAKRPARTRAKARTARTARTKAAARTVRSAAKPRFKAAVHATASARNKAKVKARPRAQSAGTTKPTLPLPSVPSSLSLDRRSSAARSGRLELADERRKHSGMSPSITGGDMDVDVESAYFTGDEAPGGDNPAPDQEVVDEIGRALGVVYDDAEELRGSEKVSERDRHRWELDPASSEDYRNRK